MRSVFPSHAEILNDFGFSDVDGSRAEIRPSVHESVGFNGPINILIPGRSMFCDMRNRMDNMMEGFRDISNDVQAQMVTQRQPSYI